MSEIFKTEHSGQRYFDSAKSGKSTDIFPAPNRSRSEHFISSRNLNTQIPLSKIINDLVMIQTGQCQAHIDYPHTRFGDQL